MLTLLLSKPVVLALSTVSSSPTLQSTTVAPPNRSLKVSSLGSNNPAPPNQGIQPNRSAQTTLTQSHVAFSRIADSNRDHASKHPSKLQIPQRNAEIETGQWLRAHFNVHQETQWKIRRVPLPGGSEVVIARELRNGTFIAGSRIALMVDASGTFRYATGQTLRPDFALPAVDRSKATVSPTLQDLWYPSGGELIPARMELSDMVQEQGSIARYKNFVSKVDGQLLGRRPAVYHAGEIHSEPDTVSAKIAGWVENPDTTPLTHYYDVPLDNLDPLVLKGPDVEVVQCATDPWSCLNCASPDCPAGCGWACETCEGCEEECEGDADCIENCESICDFCESACTECPELNESCYERFPEATEHGVFPFILPKSHDVGAHADPNDPFANTQAMQYASRFFTRLRKWNWDPNIFDVVGCPTFSDPADINPCRLRAYVNVLIRDGENNLQPLNSAFYAWGGELFMGQGTVVDSAYDLHVLVHEIGHHVTAGWGESDFSGDDIAPERPYTDNFALHEGSSDFYAILMGVSEEMAIYFRNRGGVYQWPRTRDASIPFQCPENVTGEGHMEGRIWVSAMWDIHNALMDAGLADEDLFPQIFNGAMAVIRQIPDNQERHFPEASEIMIEATDLVLGSYGADIVEAILEERGLRSCDYAIDIADEPSVTGQGDPNDAKDVRFIFLSGSGFSSDDPEFPSPPPVEHRLTLSDEESGTVLYFVPDQWRSSKRESEALQQEGLVAAALVKHGSDGVVFNYNADEFRYENDAELRFHSEAAPERGSEWRKIVIDGLEPGESYSIALASAAEVQLDSGMFLVDNMQWSMIENVNSEESGEEGPGDGPAPIPSDCSCDPRRGFSGEWTALGFIILVLPRWSLPRWARRRRNRSNLR